MSRSGKLSAPEQFVDTNSKQFTVNRSIVAYTLKSSWTPTCRPRTMSNITALSIQDIDQKSIKHIQNAIRIIFIELSCQFVGNFSTRQDGKGRARRIRYFGNYRSNYQQWWGIMSSLPYFLGYLVHSTLKIWKLSCTSIASCRSPYRLSAMRRFIGTIASRRACLRLSSTNRKQLWIWSGSNKRWMRLNQSDILHIVW